MKKIRLDDFLIQRGHAADKRSAFIVVTEGRVLVNGQKAISPAQFVATEDQIVVQDGDGYVGRGALKLDAALEQFGIDVSGKICADIGAATGGFTEVLLRRGATKVYAIDTCHGKLALKIRENPRVVVMERTDVRDLQHLPEVVDLATIDVSLIPLEQILPAVRVLIAPHGLAVALLKPQYETRDAKALRHGIVRDDAARENILERFLTWAQENNWKIVNRIESPIKGGKGNVEYLLKLCLR
ncbi:MAG: TlyA family RNA methyltransferase [Candidatus Sungbacteria bacterium]|nr:TlyA family RNA methyltransferase [Candidatus Sungbacteria bacterium]